MFDTNLSSWRCEDQKKEHTCKTLEPDNGQRLLALYLEELKQTEFTGHKLLAADPGWLQLFVSPICSFDKWCSLLCQATMDLHAPGVDQNDNGTARSNQKNFGSSSQVNS